MLIHSGQVVYKMEVEKPIPEFIDFKIFKFPINIYKGQPKSCHYCFEIGHVASNCQIKLENQKKRNDDNEINSVTVEREKQMNKMQQLKNQLFKKCKNCPNRIPKNMKKKFH